MFDIETIMLILSVLLFISIIMSKISNTTNIPTLLIFIVVGIIAGSEWPGTIIFNNNAIAQALGTVALSFILYSGGLDTKWQDIKGVMYRGVLLSTVGVVLTAGTVTLVGHFILGLDFKLSFLIGSIISSTDASAVFVSLRSKNFKLKKDLGSLLELESGSNDPTAIFLTISAISLVLGNEITITAVLVDFLKQMSIGVGIGFALGKVSQRAINRINLDHEGLYPVFSMALVGFSYSLVHFVGGNGFLSVYICGIVLGNSNIIHKKSLTRFHDGVSWLMQILMYVVLGLMVTLSDLLELEVALPGVIISLALIFFARPIGVFLILVFTKMKFKEQLLVAWIGLRGAVPIVLSIFPAVYGVPQSDFIFNVIFFVVITSTLLQGSTISFVGKKLNLLEKDTSKSLFPIELTDKYDSDSDLTEIIVPKDSHIIDKQIIDLNLPEKTLIVLISRDNQFVIPKGDTTILQGDVLLFLSKKEDIDKTKSIFVQK
jgi:cell volume regulation protein A